MQLEQYANHNNKVQIVWYDAVIYSINFKANKLPEIETTGILEYENENYFVVRDPASRDLHSGKLYPARAPIFFTIPKGMVKEIRRLGSF